jgi:hypothetical protein
LGLFSSLCKAGEPNPDRLTTLWVDFQPGFAPYSPPAMPRVAAFCLSLFLAFLANPASAREFKLYAVLTQDTEVELNTGARWLMDKGDVFPILMYKEQQTQVVLELSEANFRTETKNIRVLDENEIPAAIANYEQNVRAFQSAKMAKIKARLFARPTAQLR